MKLICVGRNYSAHIDELQNERPTDPVLFIKPDTSMLQNKHPFFLPHFSNDIHHEVEILVRIDRIGKHIEPQFAPKYYSKIGLGIDFTARTLQTELKSKGLPWEKAKAFDGSALVANWYPKEQFKNFNDIPFSLKKNGSIVQQGNTAQMLWKMDELIAYISQYFTLKIGDIVFTGTPAGVGPVHEGDVLQGYVGAEEAFTVKIK